MGTRREVVFDQLMQATEPITGDRGVHVVFRMIIHMPIKKLDYGVDRKGPATKPKVGDVVLKTDVLGTVAKKKEPAAVKRTEGGQDRDRPEVKAGGDENDQGVPDQQCPRPADRGFSFGRALGKKGQFPLALEPATRHADGVLEDLPGGKEIDKTVEEKMPNENFHREDDFKIVRRVQGVAMMTRMTDVKGLEIVPAQKGEDPDEERIERLGFKDGAMAQLVNRVRKEGTNRPVEEEQSQHQPD